jgi:hypothetical protein
VANAYCRRKQIGWGAGTVQWVGAQDRRSDPSATLRSEEISVNQPAWFHSGYRGSPGTLPHFTVKQIPDGEPKAFATLTKVRTEQLHCWQASVLIPKWFIPSWAG